jgi:hypothetical protein
MFSKATLQKHSVHPPRIGLITLLVWVFSWCGAQDITMAEYFFDVDPGPGNGTPLGVTAGNPTTFTETISTSGLKPGYHLLFVRTRTSNEWSLSEPQEFVIDGGILAAEYFFDTDPGIDNGTPLAISPITNTITESISTATLDDGEHYLYIRTRHSDGNWSLSDPQIFYIQTRIVEAEYFIDTDPGLGNGTPLSITTPTDLITITPSISTPVLANGDHYLFIRTKDILGKWSLFEPQLFQVDVTLPIELYEFKAIPTKAGQVKLQWKTVTETNNDFFTVEHSTQGTEFTAIFKIPGAGTTTHATQYEKLHTTPASGVNYYRLKQTDVDGTSQILKVVSVTLGLTTGTLVYPNPIDNTWYVKFSGRAGDSRLLEVFDLTGRKLKEYQIQGEQITELTRQGILNGTYLLKVTAPDNSIDFIKVIFH